MNGPVEYQVSEITVLGNGAFVTVHTVNNARWLRISCLHLANVTNAAVTVRLCLVPAGATAVIGNALVYDFSIPAFDFLEFGEGLRLGPNGLIRGQANAANAINCFLSGVEEGLVGA